MDRRVVAIRGATTLDSDTEEQVLSRTAELVGAIMDRNGLEPGDLISLLFTATGDVNSEFPAAAMRKMGLGAVPRLCARELEIGAGTPLCIRVMVHCYTSRDDLRHVYLEGAAPLRHELPG